MRPFPGNYKNLVHRDKLPFLNTSSLRGNENVDIISATIKGQSKLPCGTMSMKPVTYTRNVFIPVTNMCRNNCAYCGFRRDIGSGEDYLMPPAEAKALIAKAADMGCIEALFTYGDAPPDHEFSVRLQEIGYPSLTAYVRELSPVRDQRRHAATYERRRASGGRFEDAV